MYYFVAVIAIITIARIYSMSWGKTFVLPWVITTVPILVGAGLANLDLVPMLISAWSSKTHTIVIVGTMALLAGSFTLQHARGPLLVSLNEITWNEGMLLRVLMIATFVSLAANTTQFLIAGQIPLFSSDPDHARVTVAQNGYLHVFSVLAGHLIPIASLILFTGDGLRKNTKRLLVAIIVANFILLTLWIARGLVIYPILTVVAMNYILDQESYRFRKILIIAFIVISIISGVKYLRDFIRFGENFAEMQKHMITTNVNSSFVGPFVSLYLTVAENFEILNRYTNTVPALATHSYGRIMAGNVLAYIPGTGKLYTELEFQNAILKKHENDLGLTSSFFGIPYIEFGFTGVVFFSFVVGKLYKIIWLRMIQQGSPWYLLFYGYLISMTAFMPYAFLFTKVSFTWFILSSFPILFLCTCRAQGASLFITRSRIQFHN